MNIKPVFYKNGENIPAKSEYVGDGMWRITFPDGLVGYCCFEGFDEEEE